MKKLLLIAGIALATFSFISCSQPSNNGYTAAVKVSQSEWDNLTEEFQPGDKYLTRGGSLNKKNLQAFLENLTVASPTTTLVYYRFVTDPDFNQTSVVFSGGHTTEGVPCIRNGGDENAFCPSACNLRSATCPEAISLSYETYKELGLIYERSYPDATFGGNIDKAALLDIIKSIPDDATNINFRFYNDLTYKKTGIIFMGGSLNQPSGEILYLRNGLSAESFCPTNCTAD